MKRTCIGQQGEVKIYKISEIPSGIEVVVPQKTKRGDWILSHSENGNHHIIGGDAEVMERTSDVPAGMKILYAIVSKPDEIRQDATVPHGTIPVGPDLYEFRIAREFDPFAEQARRGAD